MYVQNVVRTFISYGSISMAIDIVILLSNGSVNSGCYSLCPPHVGSLFACV